MAESGVKGLPNQQVRMSNTVLELQPCNTFEGMNLYDAIPFRVGLFERRLRRGRRRDELVAFLHIPARSSAVVVDRMTMVVCRNPDLLRGVHSMNWTIPSPIQSKALPHLLVDKYPIDNPSCFLSFMFV